MKRYDFQIDQDSGRVDKYLARHIPDLSRSRIQDLISKGHVWVNGKVIKSNYKLELGDEVILEYEEEVDDILPEEGPLNILYEDDDMIVLNKPSGQVVHPAPGHMSGTLVNVLLAYTDHLSDLNGPERPGIVHRLDKDTSGALVVAKNNASHEHMAKQFKARQPLREYKALVHGQMEAPSGSIELPIGRDPKQRLKFSVQADGKEAITHFQVEKNYLSHSLLRVNLETGRTHQIRVHLSHLGHPVYGDRLYGSNQALPDHKYCLHAYRLGFNHPKTGEWMEFSADLEDHFKSTIHDLDVSER